MLFETSFEDCFTNHTSATPNLDFRCSLMPLTLVRVNQKNPILLSNESPPHSPRSTSFSTPKTQPTSRRKTLPAYHSRIRLLPPISQATSSKTPISSAFDPVNTSSTNWLLVCSALRMIRSLAIWVLKRLVCDDTLLEFIVWRRWT